VIQLDRQADPAPLDLDVLHIQHSLIVDVQVKDILLGDDGQAVRLIGTERRSRCPILDRDPTCVPLAHYLETVHLADQKRVIVSLVGQA